jgi:hypothetical protein
MSFSVTSFKTNLATGGGGARPSLYTIDINGPTAGLSFSGSSNILVKAAAIPASTIAPLTVNYMGRAIKTPGFRTFDTWTVTVLNDEDMAARETIVAWMRVLAGTLEGNRNATFSGAANQLAKHEGDATVTQMGVGGSATQSWKVHQMWPTELGEIGLDWSSDAIEEYTVAFAFDYWSHGTLTSTKDKVAKGAPKPGG